MHYNISDRYCSIHLAAGWCFSMSSEWRFCPFFLLSSTSAKIAGLEAKLRAMEDDTPGRVFVRGEKRPRPPSQLEGRTRKKRIPASRIITRPQKKSRTSQFRTRGSLI